jgi:hypothetical protein
MGPLSGVAQMRVVGRALIPFRVASVLAFLVRWLRVALVAAIRVQIRLEDSLPASLDLPAHLKLAVAMVRVGLLCQEIMMFEQQRRRRGSAVHINYYERRRIFKTRTRD